MPHQELDVAFGTGVQPMVAMTYDPHESIGTAMATSPNQVESSPIHVITLRILPALHHLSSQFLLRLSLNPMVVRTYYQLLDPI